MRKVIVGDRVKMISGSEKGKIGVVKALVKKKRGRSFVVVSGLNIKQYVKRDQSSSRFEKKEFPVDSSNVSLVANEEGLCSRVGFKLVDGLKKRYIKKTGVVI